MTDWKLLWDCVRLIRAAGNCVEHCCVTTYDAWAVDWHGDVESLSSALGLHDLVDHVKLHRKFERQIKERTALRSACHTALYRKFEVEELLMLIESYC